MSAIRPPVPSPLFPTQSPPSPARASRSDFFRAALDGVGAATPQAADEPARPVAAGAPAVERLQRPGSLLDIRV